MHVLDHAYPQLQGMRMHDGAGHPMLFDDLTWPRMARDSAGRSADNTVFGEHTIGWRNDDISVQFQYNIGSRDVSTSATGSALVLHSNGRAGASVGASAGDCRITSVDSLRYRPGHEVTAHFTSVYVGMQAGVKQYHGCLDTVDGFAFGSKDGVFGVWFVSSGVEVFTPQSAWLGDKLDGTDEHEHVLDPTAMNLYRVQYGWLGIAPAVFSVYCGYRLGWRVVHYIDLTNTQSTPHIRNPALPLQLRTVRESGLGTSAVVYCSSMRAGVTSGEEENNASTRWFAHTVLDASIAAGLARNNVFSIRNAATFHGKTNHVVAELGVVTFDNAGNKTVAFYGTKGATITGGSAAVDVDSTNSVMSIITGGTISGGTRGPATVIKAGGDRRTDVLGTGIKIYPGETFTFEAIANTFTGTVSLSARWVEKF